MNSKTNKDTKLTLQALLQKKAAKELQELKTEDVYIESLEAVVTISAVDRKVIYRLTDQAQKEDTIASNMYVNTLLIYHAVSLFRNEEFVGKNDPADVIDSILEVHEIKDLSSKVMELSGFIKLDLTEDVKN